MTPAEAAYRARKNLPPGHVGIRKAEEVVDREYAKSREIERAFWKRWKGERTLRSLQEIADLSAELTLALGTRRLIREARNNDQPWCGGYYQPGTRTLHLTPPTPIWVVVHETAHHVCHIEGLATTSPHGKDFQMVEQMMFDYLLARG